MIGGVEVQFTTLAGDCSVEVAVRVIRKYWSFAVFENGLTGERYDDFGKIPFGEVEEVFVYRNRNYADKWDSEGATPSLSNTMIHIISDEDMITIVVDEKDNKMDDIIETIEDAFQDEKFYVLAKVEKGTA